MPGLVPGIHALLPPQDVNGWDNPGHHEWSTLSESTPNGTRRRIAIRWDLSSARRIWPHESCRGTINPSNDNKRLDVLDSYSGATRIYPIIGDPVAQVKSPRNLTRGFEAAGRDAIVVPFQIAPSEVVTFLLALDCAGNVDGIIATVPHKLAAYRHASSASQRSRLLGSANLLRRLPDGGWHCDMLDGLSMVRAIEAEGSSVRERRALLVGAGGAGRAIGLELLNAGVAHLAVHDTAHARRDALLRTLGEVHHGKVSVGSSDPTGFDLVVNATPAGMRDGDAPPVLLDRIGAGMLVADVITAPEITPLLRAARARGCRTVTGVDMHDASIALMVDFFFGGH
jgi:shikimate dehydrogenase